MKPKKNTKIEITSFLNNVLKQRDENMGLNGTHSFEIRVNDGKTSTLVFRIPNLTEAAAKNLFNLVDENNQMNVDFFKNKNICLQFSYRKNDKELDMNILPNVFTDNLS
jgi:hypothetical protein